MKTSRLTPIFKRRWVRCLPLQHTRFISQAAEEYAHSCSHPKKPLFTFEDAGLRPALAKAIYTAFPDVKTATEIQSTLIPSVMKGKDIILQDETGSGKSFGLILALLNKPRLVFSSGLRDRNAITSLVLVPHRDLAFQMLHWIELIVQASTGSPPPLSSIAQVLVREGGRHLTEGLPLVRTQPPHILIATPASVLEILREDPDAFRLQELSTVALDEVDYMIETLPLSRGNQQKMRAIEKHPGPARAILEEIYKDRAKINDGSRQVIVDAPYHIPQLILSSATIRRQLKHFFFSEKHYLNRDVVKIRRSVMRLHGQNDLLADRLAMHSLVSHHALVASDSGIVNIPSAVVAKDLDIPRLNLEEPKNGPIETLPTSSDIDPVADNRSIGFSLTPSPLSQNSLEAVAAVFALDVPSIALLVIPSQVSVHRAVYDLREMGVNAHGMDLLAQDRGRTYLLQGDVEQSKTNPTLLVCTSSSIRGVDLPSLTHVFILGMDTLIAKGNWTLTLDTYVHLCGRVGRFKKHGKVITVVEGKERASIEKVLKTLDVVPSRFNAFE